MDTLWVEDASFQTSPEQEVCFMRGAAGGQWHARVTDVIGRFTQVRVLPVFCGGHGDVAAAVQKLRALASKHVQKRIHVMRRVESADVMEFVYVGEQHLKGGSITSRSSSGQHEASMSSRVENNNVIARSVSTELNQCGRIVLENISSIEDLVAALNKCRAPEDAHKMKVLQACVRECKNIFMSRHLSNWTERNGEALHEYSMLAGISLQLEGEVDYFRAEKKELLKEFFTSLAEKIGSAEYNHTALIDAINFSLCKIDVCLFAETPGWVLTLANKLLERLDSTSKRYTHAHYHEHRSTFCALHKAMVIIGLVDTEQWDVTKEKSLFSRFRKGLEKITEVTSYYPIKFHVSAIEQSLLRLAAGIENTGILKRAAHLLQGSFTVCQCLSSLIAVNTFLLGILAIERNLRHLESGLKEIRQGFSREQIEKLSWYDLIVELNCAYMMSLTESKEESTLRSCLLRIEAIEKKMSEGSNRIALRFGFVKQLCIIVVKHPTFQLRKECLRKLLFLASSWQENVEVLDELLVCLGHIADQYRCEGKERQTVEGALKTLRGTLGVSGFWSNSELSRSQEIREHVDAICSAWENVDQILETVMAMDDKHFITNPEENKWSSIISGCVGGEAAQEAVLHTDELKRRYSDDTFAPQSLFLVDDEGNYANLIDCQLIQLHQNSQGSPAGSGAVTSSNVTLEEGRNKITLADIFHQRFHRTLGNAPEIRKVIVVGQAGVGKTTLSLKLAYEWSQGRWCNNLFDAVYVLPVRELHDTQFSCTSTDANLATAIACICFPDFRSEKESDSLHAHINMRLKSSKTLVVLDGLDEEHGVLAKIIKEAMRRSSKEHKLLILSRSYGIGNQKADVVVEHVGFSSYQIKCYTKGKLPPEQSDILLDFIDRQSSLKTIVHIPLNLEILCRLWEDRESRAAVYSGTGGGSVAELYRLFTDKLWDQFRNKKIDDSIDKEVLVAQLGKIALLRLQQSQEPFTVDFMKKALGMDERGVRKLLEFTGFLLQCSHNKWYSFFHKTFQEYFAGRLLASQLMSETENDQRKAEEVINLQKYNQQCGMMLSFMAGELIDRDGINGIKKAFEVVNKGPQEIIGVRHMLVKLKLLNEWLCSGCEDGSLYLDDDVQVLDPVANWLKHHVDHAYRNGTLSCSVIVADVLKEILQSFPAIFNHAPHLLKLVLELTIDRDAQCHTSQLILNTIVLNCPYAGSMILEHVVNRSSNSNGDDLGVPLMMLENVVRAFFSDTVDITKWIIHCADEGHRHTVPAEFVRCLGKSIKASLSDAPGDFLNLEYLFKNETPLVRETATEFSRQLMSEFSFRTPSGKEHLIAMCRNQDEDEHLRMEATRYLVVLAESSASAAPTVVDCLVQLCKDQNRRISKNAFMSLENLVGRCHSHRTSVMNHLKRMCQNDEEDEHVRAEATTSLAMLAEGSLVDGSAIVDCLLDLCEDENITVSKHALEALKWCVKQCLEHNVTVLDFLTTMCNSEGQDGHVRQEAHDSLHKVLDAFPSCISNKFARMLREHECETSRAWSHRIKSFGNLAAKYSAVDRASVLDDFLVMCDAQKWEKLAMSIRYLQQLVDKHPLHSAALQERIEEVCDRTIVNICMIAREAIERLDCEQLMDAYWEIQDRVFIPPIVAKLRTMGLVLLEKTGTTSLVVLYRSGGGRVTWSKPKSEVKTFRDLCELEILGLSE